MSGALPACKSVTVVLFRGGLTPTFGARITRELDDQKKGVEQGPSMSDCLLFAGHTGVSTDDGTTVYGFNPDGTGAPLWQLIDDLKKGALPSRELRRTTRRSSPRPGPTGSRSSRSRSSWPPLNLPSS